MTDKFVTNFKSNKMDYIESMSDREIIDLLFLIRDANEYTESHPVYVACVRVYGEFSMVYLPALGYKLGLELAVRVAPFTK